MSVAIWERGGAGTNESERAYRQFKQYLELGDQRSIQAVYKANGTSKAATQELAQRHKWRERALAYDRYVARKELEAQMAENEASASIEDYREFIKASLRRKLSRIETLILKEITRLEDEQAQGKPLSALELKRLLSVIGEQDALARRSAGMATTYRANAVDEPTDPANEETYFIGGD